MNGTQERGGGKQGRDERHPGRDVLERFADGDLPEAEQRRIAAHLGTCVACRREVESYRALFAALDDVPLPEPPAGFDARVLDAVLPATVPRSLPEDALLIRMMAWVYALVASLAAVGVSVLVVLKGPASLQNVVGFVLSRMVRGLVDGSGLVVSGVVDLVKAAGDLLPAAEVVKPLGRGLETVAGAMLVPQVVLPWVGATLLALTVLVWAASSARERSVPHVSLSL